MPAPVRDPGRIPGKVFIDNCVTIRLFWELANKKIAFNVLHASYVSEPPLTEAYVEALQTTIEGALNTSTWPTSLDVETRLKAVGIRDMRDTGDGTGLAEWVSSGGGVPGTGIAGGPLPFQLAFVVSLKTGFAGQANRGRVYLPGLHSSCMTSDGLIDDGDKNSAVNFIKGIRDSIDNQGLTLCIAHPARQAYTGRDDTPHPARASGTVPVTNIVALDNTFDTQRLRARI